MVKVKKHIGYADVGSHGGIFYFQHGPVGDRYPGLLHIYKTQLTPDLVPVYITPKPKRRGK